MQTSRRSKAHPIQLSSATWWHLAAFVGIVLPFVLSIVFDRQIYHLYVMNFLLPTLEDQLGFSSRAVPLATPGYPTHSQFTITSIRRDSPLTASGFRVGDVPTPCTDVEAADCFVTRIRRSLETGNPVDTFVVNSALRDSSGQLVRRQVTFRPSPKP